MRLEVKKQDIGHLRKDKAVGWGRSTLFLLWVTVAALGRCQT